MEQRTKLQAKLWQPQKSQFPHKLSWEIFRCRFLKIVCEVVLDMRLLKTSILVTRTPLTTLKCLSRKYISHALIENPKDRIFVTVKDVLDDLFGGLKQFANAWLLGRLEE
jgi:hypothetical protein